MSVLFWGIVIGLIFLFFFFLRARHTKHRITAILVILLLLFVYITASHLIKKNQIELKSTEGVFRAVKVYFSWLGHAFKNVGTIIGNAVKMDWKLKNETAQVNKTK